MAESLECLKGKKQFFHSTSGKVLSSLQLCNKLYVPIHSLAVSAMLRESISSRWIHDNNVIVTDWPAQSFDLKLTENIRRVMISYFYQGVNRY